MITSLTEFQKLEIIKTRDEWLQICQTQKDITIQDVEKGVEQLYALDNRKKPVIIILDDPLQCQYLANIISNKKGDQIDAKIRDQIYDQIYDPIDAKIGAKIDAKIHDQISAKIRDPIDAQINAKIRDPIRAKIHDQIYAQISAKIHDPIDAQISAKIRDPIYAQISAKIHDPIYNQIGAKIGAKINAKINAKIRDQHLTYFFQLGGLSWRSLYYAYFDYYLKTGLIKVDNELKQKTNQQIEFLKKGVWDLIVFQNICIISRCPKTKRDENHRLHSVTTQAVEFKSGYGFYAIHGIVFEEELWNKVVHRKLNAKKLLTIKNVDQRFVAIQHYGFENILDTLDKTFIDKGKFGNELYSTNFIGEESRFITYPDIDNPNKRRISFVPPTLKTADDAMAYKHNCTVEEYYNMEILLHL